MGMYKKEKERMSSSKKETAWEAYKKATAVAEEDCEKAIAKAWEAYKKAK